MGLSSDAASLFRSRAATPASRRSSIPAFRRCSPQLASVVARAAPMRARWGRAGEAADLPSDRESRLPFAGPLRRTVECRRCFANEAASTAYASLVEEHRDAAGGAIIIEKLSESAARCAGPHLRHGEARRGYSRPGGAGSTSPPSDPAGESRTRGNSLCARGATPKGTRTPLRCAGGSAPLERCRATKNPSRGTPRGGGGSRDRRSRIHRRT